MKRLSTSIILGGIAFVALFLFASATTQAEAADLSGWAWSSNTGWVSFNSTNPGSGSGASYAVQVDATTGAFSGYAWSSTLGWLSFNAADTVGCPVGPSPAVLNSTTGQVSGCARFINGIGRTDGWNGWVALSGTNHPSPNLSGNGGVTFDSSTKNFRGFSWGNPGIGWLNWNTSIPGGGVTCPLCGGTSSQFNYGISANNISVTAGSSAFTPVDIVRLGSTDNSITNVTVTGLPGSVNGTWKTLGGVTISGARTCASILPGACSFNYSITAPAGNQGVYPLVITATTADNIVRTKDIILTIATNTGGSVPAVILKVNGQNGSNVKVRKDSTDNVVSWERVGSNTFDECRASSAKVNSQPNNAWNGDAWVGDVANASKNNVTIDMKTTFTVTCSKGAQSRADSVTVDAVANPTFIEF